MTRVLFDGPEPVYAHYGDAGFDLRAELPDDRPSFVMKPGDRALINTGLRLELPPTHVGLVCSRSGLALRSGVSVANAPGVVDSSYRGPVKVILINHSSVDFVIEQGDRIAQMLIQRVATRFDTEDPLSFVRIEHPDQLSPTVRGEGGFGSSGVK